MAVQLGKVFWSKFPSKYRFVKKKVKQHFIDCVCQAGIQDPSPAPSKHSMSYGPTANLVWVVFVAKE
jgi:hypothetical protein